MTKQTAWCGVCVLLLSTLALADKDKKYTLADLKALVQQKSYQEAIEHLEDIAPADRNADWQDVAGQAAVGMVGTGKDAMTKVAYMIGIEGRFPAVLKYGKYAALRADVGPKGFEACFKASYGDVSECLDHATKFVDADPTNGKLALAVAKIARRNMNAYGAIPLFKRASAATKGGVCKDDDFQLAVHGALGLPGDYDNAKDGRELAGSCWSELRKSVVAELGKHEGGYFKTNACEVMKAKNDRDAAKLCAEHAE